MSSNNSDSSDSKAQTAGLTLASSPNPPEVHPSNSLRESGGAISIGTRSDLLHKVNSDYVNTKRRTSRSSLEMRKLPVDILLKPASDDDSIGASTIDDSFDDMKGAEAKSASASFLHKTCLNSNFSLRVQMMLSFGLVSSCTIILVVAVGMVTALLAGDRVIDITQDTFEDLAKNVAGTTAHYLSDDLTPRILPNDLIQIIYQATRDRFAGYPTYEDDSQVPFWDIESKSNFYPVQGKPLPLDWQMNDGGNVNASSYHEHVQDRLPWYSTSPTLDTSSAVYYMQGMCDPSATDPESSRYLPNCTDANNNITTGGVYAPSPTNAQIHRKASDLSPLLKSLYEYHQSVKNIGLYFANSGAGATVTFPHYELNSNNTYESAGCNWMLNDHPIDPTRTFATLEEFERCEQGGRRVKNGNPFSARLYNPMDREWCMQQALEPEKVHHSGPLESAWWQGYWFMTLGRAVYDPITNDFIACIAVDFAVDSVEYILRESKVTPGSEVSVVRFNDYGTVVASTAWNTTFANGTVPIDKIDVGVTQDIYQTLHDLVDYKSEWDAEKVAETYEETLLHGEGYLVAIHPIPPVPAKYKDDYRPEFLVVVSVAEEEFFLRSNELKGSVDEKVIHLERAIMIVGCVGLVVMVLIIFMVANALTSPLDYMNKVAFDIISNFGDTAEDTEAIEVDRKSLASKCVPKTELEDIVKEFLKMVKNFSGSNMAKNAQEKTTEIENRFSLVDEFRDLYESRADEKFKYRFRAREVTVPEKLGQNGPPPHRVNFGRIVIRDAFALGSATTSNSGYLSDENSKKGMASPLFFWIVVLIVSPLLLTTITISCVLMVNISKSFPDFVDVAKGHFVEEELFALKTFVGLRANLTAATTERATRDLHVLNRFTNWIIFGGLNRTAGFTEMTTGLEACKEFSNFNECPYVQETVCDCDWRDKSCDTESEDSRHLQQTFFACESHDTEPNGDRFSTSFPDVSSTQATTAWWDNVTEIPGYERPSLLGGYDSTYARLRSSSAIPVIQLLHNYDVFQETTILGVYVAFEDDGLFLGYEGCSFPGNAGYAEWVSSVENGAYDLRPELCPLGKYGYDPRCRNWYHKGKDAKGVNESFIYATPPYQFASSAIYAQSASSPLLDPRTGEHVGQTLIDYVSQPILDSLGKENFALSGKGFPVLITIESDNFGADTVIGPGLEGEARPIADLVLPNDPGCEGTPKCKEGFYAILSDMKAGNSDTAKFTRVADDGSEEVIYISYAPVVVKSFSPVDSSDFSRGVFRSDYVLYSLAFAEYEDAMLDQFNEIEDEIDTQFYITLAVLCFTILLSTIFVIYISNVITVSITEPMLHLLELVRTINGLRDGEDRPEPPMDLRYGSSEVLNVTYTMERLHKVIRSANTAFFAGDVETAYEVLKEALKLFKRLGNKKAVGVANNNLGNTLLAAYRTLKAAKEKRICGFKKREIIAKGTACFHEAIQQGEAAYDEFYEREGWSPNCLDFMQHLSNRYFNRAMFLLTVKNDHPKPDEIQELGMRDLQISRDMDVEINDEGTQIGWNVRTVDKTFEVMLSRFKGHISLLEMGYPDEFELDEWMYEAFQIVRTELKNRGTSALFFELGPAGRMQQIESALMKYYDITGDISTAGKTAIRMLVEDEYTLPSAQIESVDLLLRYADMGDSGISADVKDALSVHRTRVAEAIDEIDLFRVNQTDEFDGLSGSLALSVGIDDALGMVSEHSTTELTARRRISLMQSSRGDITMEMF